MNNLECSLKCISKHGLRHLLKYAKRVNFLKRYKNSRVKKFQQYLMKIVLQNNIVFSILDDNSFKNFSKNIQIS